MYALPHLGQVTLPPAGGMVITVLQAGQVVTSAPGTLFFGDGI